MYSSATASGSGQDHGSRRAQSTSVLQRDPFRASASTPDNRPEAGPPGASTFFPTGSVNTPRGRSSSAEAGGSGCDAPRLRSDSAGVAARLVPVRPGAGEGDTLRATRPVVPPKRFGCSCPPRPLGLGWRCDSVTGRFARQCGWLLAGAPGSDAAGARTTHTNASAGRGGSAAARPGACCLPVALESCYPFPPTQGGMCNPRYDDSRFDGALSGPRSPLRGRPATCVEGSD